MLEQETKDVMDEVMKEWQQRKRGVSTYDTGNAGTGNDSNVTLPLSQGEWDEPLGLPLCVVCHGVSSARRWIVSPEFGRQGFKKASGLTKWFARLTKSTLLRWSITGMKKNLTTSYSFCERYS